MKRKLSNTSVMVLAFLCIPVTWFALLIAPLFSCGLKSFVNGFSDALSHPFQLTFCGDSIITVLVLLGGYLIGLCVLLTDEKNYRKREEYGSAKWGVPSQVKKKYEDTKAPDNNIILTQNTCIGLDGHKHRRNLNVLVCGGSGAGKTRFYAKPNIMQANCSFVITDPKGEILRSTGQMLIDKGYDVKVLDLIDMEKSNRYNPFAYLQTDNDVQRLVTNLFQNTTPKGAKSQDPFWDTAAQMLLLALIFYLKYQAQPDDRNFANVLELIRCGEVSEEDENRISPLDFIFNELEQKVPDHIAVKYYKAYHSGAGKTLKSIQITLLSRLEKFNLPSLSALTMTDEMELQTLGEKKTAVFCVIPDNDTSFNFLVGMLYTQMFQQLYYSADILHGGRLPVHVHFMMDEFANVALPDQFDKVLSTMRSREISVSIIIQNMAQLKALFEKEWENIVGNCDEFLYLGGNEQSTHEYIMKLLGKETIDTNTYGKSKGQSGSYSTNYQSTGRELMMADEIRRLDNAYSILFIRGEPPVKDLKFDIEKHKNFKMISDGGQKPYDHGSPEYTAGEMILPDISAYLDSDDVGDSEIYIYSNEEIEEIMLQNENES